MPFDLIGARKAGYNDRDIAQFLAEQEGFDYYGAVRSGYSDSEILGDLLSKTGAGVPEDNRSGMQKAGDFIRDAVMPVPANAWAQVKQGAGGLVRQAGDLTGLDAVSQYGKEMSDDAQMVQEQILAEHGTDPDDWTTATRSALTSTYQQLPFMAIGALRAAPSVAQGIVSKVAAGEITEEAGRAALKALSSKAATPALAMMGGVSAGQSYDELRDKGNSPLASTVGSTLTGLVEVGTEKLPTEKFIEMLSPTAKFSVKALAKEFGQYYGAEMIGESLATFLQDSISKAMDRPDMSGKEMLQAVSDYISSGEAKQNFLNTLKSTAVQSTLMGGGAGMARYAASPTESYLQQSPAHTAPDNEPQSGMAPPSSVKLEPATAQEPNALAVPAERTTPSGPLEKALGMAPEQQAQPEPPITPAAEQKSINELVLDDARTWAEEQIKAGNTGLMQINREPATAYAARIVDAYQKRDQPAPTIKNPLVASDSAVETPTTPAAVPKQPMIATVNHDEDLIASIDDADRNRLKAAREMVDYWQPGSMQNGPSNKTELFPWLSSWPTTTPREIGQAIDNYLAGKKLGTVQRRLIAETVKYERERTPAENDFEFPAAEPFRSKAKRYAAKVGANLDGLPDEDVRTFVDTYDRWVQSQSRGTAQPQGISSLIGERRGLRGTVTPVDAQAHEAATSPHNGLPEPSPAQIEAGNYQKGHVRFHGLDISIENPAGSLRKGVDETGRPWQTELAHHYGYIKGTVGKDKDHLDVFIGPDHQSARAYVVDQRNLKSGGFDEHKIMLGFESPDAARQGYLDSYDETGPQRIIAVTDVPVEELKQWMRDGNTKKPFAGEVDNGSVSAVREETGKTEEVPPVRGGDEVKEGKDDSQSRKTAEVTNVDKFVDRDPVHNEDGSQDKARYEFREKDDKDKTIAAVKEFEGMFKRYSRDNPITGKFGHKIYFEPDGRAIARLGDEDAWTEYALHSVTSTKNKDFNVREYDPSKVSNLSNINNVITDADGYYEENGKTYYFKKVRDGKKPNAAVVLEMSKDGQVEDYRYVSQLPNRKNTSASLVTPAAKDPNQEQSGGTPSPDSNEIISPDGKNVKGDKTITDFGEKIGGARKDLVDQNAASPSMKRDKTEEPAWKKRFKALQKMDGSDRWVIADVSNRYGRSGSQTFATKEEAEEAIPLYAVGNMFYPNQEKDGTWEIYKRVGDRKRLKMTQQGFTAREDALKYMALNADALLNTKTSFGEEILPVPDTVVRTGTARRTSNATPEMFMETFAPRGIEFGNWNNQDERQLVMNHAYDGLLDLADTLNVPPKTLMLNGDLAIAFGARGQGLSGAKAHYEPSYGVINLTKMKGAGSLAHEWMHAFDHYLARLDEKAKSEKTTNKRGDSVYPEQSDKFLMQSHGPSYKSKMREELKQAYDSLVKGLFRKAEQYVEDTQRADEFLAAARNYLREELDNIRKNLATDYAEQYTWKKNKKGLHPASAEQLAEFDRLADSLVEGGNLDLETRIVDAKFVGRRTTSYGWSYQSNEVLDAINQVYKTVRNQAGFRKDGGVLNKVVAAMRTYSQRMQMFDEAQAGTEKTKSVPTNYAIEAKKMDQARSGDYWSEPHEMVARAFASYVEDKIANSGGQSEFLVYHAHGGILLPMIDGFVARPYPEGTEREAINKAFDAFIGAIKTKETEKGIALFSRNAEKGTPLSEVKFNAVFDRITAGLKDSDRRALFAPVDTFAELPATIKLQAQKQDAGPEDVKGVFHKGKVYIVRDNISSEEILEEALFHEWHGHYGFNRMFDGKVRERMLELYHQIGGAGKLFAIGNKYGINLMEYGQGLAKAGYDIDTRRAIMTEEMLAHLTSEYSDGDIAAKIREVIGVVRSWLRDHGFMKLAEWGETDIAWLLKRARMYATQNIGQNTQGETVFISVDDIIRRLQTQGVSEQQLQNALSYQPKFMTAWHGSPHAFDKFSTEHIGSGEGAQSYGYGLYFAGKKEVAEHYRTGLSSKDFITKAREAYDQFDSPSEAVEALRNSPELSEAQHELINALEDDDWLGFDYPHQAISAALKNPDNYEMSQRTMDALAKQGNLYQVELAPEEDEYLLWDKPLSEQSTKVKDSLTAAIDKIEEKTRNEILAKQEKAAGAYIYNNLKIDLGSDEAASEYLHSLGIRGIKYLDGSSRNDGEGTYNYVIFNDRDVDITAMFSLKSELDRISPAGTLEKVKNFLNPFDYSRFKDFAARHLPEDWKLGMVNHLMTPLWKKETDKAAAPFYDEAAEREVQRFENNIRMFGGLVEKDGTLTTLDKLRKLVSWTGKETAWAKLRRLGYDHLSNEEKTAFDILRFEGDANGREYATLTDALRNPRIKAAKPTEKVFAFYRTMLQHERESFETKLQIARENMEEAGMSKEDIEGHIAEYRTKFAELKGWVHRDHGEGDYVVSVHHVVNRLDFRTDSVQHKDAPHDRIRLPYYPGHAIVQQIQQIVDDFGGTFKQTDNGTLIMLFPEGEGKPALERLQGINLQKEDGSYYKVMAYNRFVRTKAAAEKLAKEVGGNLAAAMPVNYRKDHTYEVQSRFSDKVREYEFQSLQSSDMELERVLSTALEKARNRGVLSKEEYAEVQQAVVQNTAETLLGRGAGLYQIRRVDHLIEGYDRIDAIGKYEQYVNGVAGMFSKARYALRQYKNLQTVPARLRKWAFTYVQDSLRNMGWGDRLSGDMRALASLWYLGFSTSWMMINATQPYTLGFAELSKYTKGSGLKIAAAQKDILAGKLTEEEQNLFMREDVLTQERESFAAELAGQGEGLHNKASRFLHGAVQVSLAVGQKVEILNRRTMILAAYRTFIDQGMGKEKALKEALHVNSIVNIDMGRHNLPKFARNSLGRTFYTLQSYIQHVLNYMWHNSSSGDRRDQKAVLRLLFTMFLLGGLPAGAPGSDELDKLIRNITGYSPKLQLRLWLQRNAKDYGSLGEALDGFVWHGIPGALKPLGVGVSLTGAVQFRLPIISNILAGDDVTKSATGAVGGLAQKFIMAAQQASRGDMGRAAEYAAPTAVANVMSGIRQRTEGVRTSHGQPVLYKGAPLKMDPIEGTLRMFGMQPVRTSDISESRQNERWLESEWGSRRTEALDEFRFGHGMAPIQRFNRELATSQASGLIRPITSKSIRTVRGKMDKRKTAWESRSGVDFNE